MRRLVEALIEHQPVGRLRASLPLVQSIHPFHHSNMRTDGEDPRVQGGWWSFSGLAYQMEAQTRIHRRYYSCLSLKTSNS